MVRFHFHILNGLADDDVHGTELPDVDAAKHQAVRMMGEILREAHPRDIWGLKAWKLLVNDRGSSDSGRTYFSLEIAARDAA
jgi:hypothetical protein